MNRNIRVFEITHVEYGSVTIAATSEQMALTFLGWHGEDCQVKSDVEVLAAILNRDTTNFSFGRVRPNMWRVRDEVKAF